MRNVTLTNPNIPVSGYSIVRRPQTNMSHKRHGSRVTENLVRPANPDRKGVLMFYCLNAGSALGYEGQPSTNWDDDVTALEAVKDKFPVLVITVYIGWSGADPFPERVKPADRDFPDWLNVVPIYIQEADPLYVPLTSDYWWGLHDDAQSLANGDTSAYCHGDLDCEMYHGYGGEPGGWTNFKEFYYELKPSTDRQLIDVVNLDSGGVAVDVDPRLQVFKLLQYGEAQWLQPITEVLSTFIE